MPVLRSLVALIFVAALAAQPVRYRDQVFSQVSTQAGIVYGAAFNPWTSQVETLRLDRYEPAGDTAGSRPAVVVVHGGGFFTGSRTAPPIVALCNDLARRGYLAVSISYRLASSQAQAQANQVAVIEDAMEDFKAAVRFLRSMAGSWGIDASRIVATGSSAGGFTVLAGAYQEGEGSSGNPGFSSEVQAIAPLWGGLLDVNDMEVGEAPVILVHGTLDPVVPFVRSQDVFNQAQAIGIPSELHPLVGLGHGPWNAYFTGPHADVLAFFFEHLRLGQLAGLRVDEPALAAGTLILEATGIAGDQRVLGVAAAEVAIPAGDLGVLCLDLASLAIIPLPDFTTAERLPTAAITLALPPLPAGLTVQAQELHLENASTPRLLTNCVTLAF